MNLFHRKRTQLGSVNSGLELSSQKLMQTSSACYFPGINPRKIWVEIFKILLVIPRQENYYINSLHIWNEENYIFRKVSSQSVYTFTIIPSTIWRHLKIEGLQLIIVALQEFGETVRKLGYLYSKAQIDERSET